MGQKKARTDLINKIVNTKEMSAKDLIRVSAHLEEIAGMIIGVPIVVNLDMAHIYAERGLQSKAMVLVWIKNQAVQVEVNHKNGNMVSTTSHTSLTNHHE